MLSRIELNWELFRVIDADIKKMKYSQKISSSGLEPQM